MSLHITAPAAEPALVRFDPKKWLDKVKAFKQLKLRKTETAKDAKAADDAHKNAQKELLIALGDATAGTCGNYVLSVKTSADANASITLTNGRVVKWADVTSILIGNETIARADVTSIYGGRSGSTGLEIAGG